MFSNIGKWFIIPSYILTKYGRIIWPIIQCDYDWYYERPLLQVCRGLCGPLGGGARLHGAPYRPLGVGRLPEALLRAAHWLQDGGGGTADWSKEFCLIKWLVVTLSFRKHWMMCNFGQVKDDSWHTSDISSQSLIWMAMILKIFFSNKMDFFQSCKGEFFFKKIFEPCVTRQPFEG